MQNLLNASTSLKIHICTQPDFVHYIWVCYNEGLLYFYHLIIYSLQSALAMASDTPTTVHPYIIPSRKTTLVFMLQKWMLFRIHMYSYSVFWFVIECSRVGKWRCFICTCGLHCPGWSVGCQDQDALRTGSLSWDVLPWHHARFEIFTRLWCTGKHLCSYYLKSPLWRQKQHFPPKHQYLPTRLHGITTLWISQNLFLFIVLCVCVC
jgi:hypothetical protein